MPKREHTGFKLKTDNPDVYMCYRTKKERNKAISARQQESRRLNATGKYSPNMSFV